ncbi:hypothetical protein RHGRI_035265 [Rhododendron griersonianum]|uniref:F-box domain-containing protein n=1 Tax=Rhododendron griersonianum TaxID=479676 RepID=A0AAV6I3Y2_9ERIC|nr:hypothetical protein RHGRI_035265 [Rhododendron griersonianum]
MSDYYLPPEVLSDVLLRLPVKTLLRHWYGLITNPTFISQHLDKTLATPPPTCALVRYCTQDPNHPSHFVERYSVRFDHDNNSFDEYTEPSFPFKSSSSCFEVVGSCNGLVCLFDDVSKDESDQSKPAEDTERSGITTFGFKDEEFGELTLPEFGVVGTMMRLQDSLSLIDIAPYPEDSCKFIWWVWVMKEYGVGESWTLLYRVHTGDALHGLVGFRMNRDLVMATDEGSLVTYDPESKQVKDVGIKNKENGAEETEKLKDEEGEEDWMASYAE